MVIGGGWCGEWQLVVGVANGSLQVSSQA